MKKIRVFVLLTFIIATLAVPPVAAKPGDGQERVIVYFQPGKMNQVRGTLLSARGEIHFEFAKYNAFAVTLPVNALNGITRNPNVTLVELDAVREPSSTAMESIIDPQVMPYGVDMVQAPDMWKEGFTGKGVVVCIIDTGLSTVHEDIIDANIDGGQSIEGFNWDDDGDVHGTHVAGTIVAQDNGFGVVGVSPDASLYIFKIFGDDGLWVSGPKTTASNLVFAADTCADNGADIISMSLGGGKPTKLEERAFEGYYAAGILSVAAAGNENDPEDPTTWGVLHYPASYPTVTSVAAVDKDGVVADFSQRNDTLELSAPGVGVLSTTSYLAEDALIVEEGPIDIVVAHIEYSGYDTASGYLIDGGYCAPGMVADWIGKVVLCARGAPEDIDGYSFLDKVTTVQDNGGVGAIIYNNPQTYNTYEPGLFYGTLGESVSYPTIIAVSTDENSGETLLSYTGQNATVTSSYENPGNGYEAWGGTSMATPHVSAVAALLWGYCPNATNEEIRQAMIDGALPLPLDDDPGFDTDYGYGLVQALGAMSALDCGGTGDLTPPVISIVATSSKGKTRWTISYATDELAQCTVTVDSTEYPEIGFSLIHDLTVKTSAPLEFSIACVDEAGNESIYPPIP